MIPHLTCDDREIYRQNFWLIHEYRNLVRHRLIKQLLIRNFITAPVVITSQTHQAVGGYPVQVQQNPGMQQYQTVMMPPQQNVSMPMQQGYPPQQGYVKLMVFEICG